MCTASNHCTGTGINTCPGKRLQKIICLILLIPFDLMGMHHNDYSLARKQSFPDAVHRTLQIPRIRIADASLLFLRFYQFKQGRPKFQCTFRKGRQKALRPVFFPQVIDTCGSSKLFQQFPMLSGDPITIIHTQWIKPRPSRLSL